MTDYTFLSVLAAMKLHAAEVKHSGGTKGIRDHGALESALAAPKNDAHYNNASIEQLAASYLFHICQNHPFVDGNKRTAFMSAKTFLRVNGYDFVPDQDALYDIVIRTAEGTLHKNALTDALRPVITHRVL